MILYKEAATVGIKIEKIRLSGKTIGFVPTMGALHAGHISLIQMSKKQCDVTVCSIFVNPTQFNDPTDFEKYPTTTGTDILLLENAGCDILFLPTITEIYPRVRTSFYYKLGQIEHVLEGKYRPDHFQGVCQAVHKLLDIVNPHKLFLGQKDYQQCLIIERLIQLIHHPAKVITAPTVREETGLAMSSRNLRLNEAQKTKAVGISKMLQHIAMHFPTTPPDDLQKYATTYLLDHGFEKVDYVSIVDAETLQPVSDIAKGGRVIALIAAYLGDVRLIDNRILND